MKKLLFIIAVFTVFSCGTEDVCKELTLGQAIELSTENLVCIEGTEYTFTAEDSRCPCGQTCVWEGEFILYFDDAAGNTIFTYHQVMEELNVDPPFGESFTLVSIDMENECGDQSSIDEVLFTILVD